MSSTSRRMIMAMMTIAKLSSSSSVAQSSVSTRLISKFAKQAKIAHSVSVKKKIDSFVSKTGERRNLQFGHYKAEDTHCHNVFHESHDWWSYDHGPALEFDQGRWIPDRNNGVEYCDVTSGSDPTDNGGFGPVCKCPWIGHKGIVMRNVGHATIHQIEVSLIGTSGQIAWYEKEGLAFAPGEEIRIGADGCDGCNGEWDWTEATRIRINGDYIDPNNPAKISGFLVQPIDLEISHCSTKDMDAGSRRANNPIGTLDTVHQNNDLAHHADQDIKLAIVAAFDAKHPNQDLCSDGWVQCSKLNKS